MRFFSRTKREGEHSRISHKVLFFALLAMVNVFAVSAVSLAWFISQSSYSELTTVSGDLNVEILKLTAHKKVYPYYKNSTEFFDYGVAPTLKSYVVEDASVFEEYEINPAIAFSNTSTFTLSTPESSNGTLVADAPGIGPLSIHYSTDEDFRYWLIGDSVFTGIDGLGWSTLASPPVFALRSNVTVAAPAVLENVVVSAGAKFALFDKNLCNMSTGAYKMFSYSDPEETNSRFIASEDGYIVCLKSGIYNFSYAPNQLTITLNNTRTDDAIIGNNLLDPLLISIDYSGSVNRDNPEEPDYFPTIDSYMPKAIYDQETMVVLDVKLRYKNANSIDAALRINREASSSNSIFSLADRYLDTESFNASGTVLRASDFYTFYAVLSTEDHAFTSATDLWGAMHIRTDAQTSLTNDFAKFVNAAAPASFDASLVCPLHLKGKSSTAAGASSIKIPASLENIYHCYVGIDYDHAHTKFFLEPSRLGKTYPLNRDFQLYFQGIQHLEGA